MVLFLLSFLFLAPAIAQYCSSGPTTTVDGNLGFTAFWGDTKNFSDSSDCPGSVGVRDLTYLVADVHFGGTYTLTYNVTSCGNVFPTVSGAWIDFDQNGSFDPTELLFPFNRSHGLITTRFTINVTSPIKNGMTRMRVQVQETSATTIYPCSVFPYGGTKDFNISVGNASPPRCNSGPTTTQDGNLGSVTLKGDTLTISDTLGCPGQIGPIDETAMVADITPGATYNITYNVSTCGNVYDSITTAWIDYNGDSQLEDWERIIPYSTRYGVNTVSFRAATNGTNQTVITGKVWMRVQMQETNANFISPCMLFPYGGTKDFSIQLRGSYCNSGPTSLNGVQLGPVQVLGQTTTINEKTTCPGGTGPVLYLNESADLIQGEPWVISYTVVNCGTPSTFSSAAWIDYDQNGIFAAWEQITPISSQSNNTFQFKVPVSTPDEIVKAGLTRLRVQVQGGVTSGALNPCNIFQHGGTKDFSVKIITTSTTKVNAQIETSKH